MKLLLVFCLIIATSLCLEIEYLDTNIVFSYSPTNFTFVCNGNQVISQKYLLFFERSFFNKNKHDNSLDSPKESLLSHYLSLLEKLKHPPKNPQTVLKICFPDLTLYSITNLSSSNNLTCNTTKNNDILCTSNTILSSFYVEYNLTLSCNNYCTNPLNTSTFKFNIPLTLNQSDGLVLKLNEPQQLQCQCIPPPPPPQPAICSTCVYKSNSKTHLYNKTVGQKISLESQVNTVHTHLSSCNVTYFTANKSLVVGTIIFQWMYHWKVNSSFYINDIGNVFLTLPFDGNYSIHCCTSSSIDMGLLIVFHEGGDFVELLPECPSLPPIVLEESDVAFYFANTTVENIEYQCSTANFPDECIQFMLKYTTPQDNIPYYLDIKTINNKGGQLNRVTSIEISQFLSNSTCGNQSFCYCNHGFVSYICTDSYSDCVTLCNDSITQYGPTDYIPIAIGGVNWINTSNVIVSADIKNKMSPLISPPPIIATYFTTVAPNATYNPLYILYQVLSYNTTTQQSVVSCPSCTTPLDNGYLNISTQKNTYSDYQVSSSNNYGQFDCNNAFYTMQNFLVTDQPINNISMTWNCHVSPFHPKYSFIVSGEAGTFNDYTCTVYAYGFEIFKVNTQHFLSCNGNHYQWSDCDFGSGATTCTTYCELFRGIEVGETITYTCCTSENQNNYPQINSFTLNFNGNSKSTNNTIVPDYLTPPFSCSGTLGTPCPTANDSVLIEEILNTAIVVVPNILISDNVIWCGINLYDNSSLPNSSNVIMRFTLSQNYFNTIRNIQCLGGTTQTTSPSYPGCQIFHIAPNQILFLQCVSSGSSSLPVFSNIYSPNTITMQYNTGEDSFGYLVATFKST